MQCPKSQSSVDPGSRFCGQSLEGGVGTAAPLRTRLENILLTWREAELSVLIGKRFEVDVADSGVDMAALERCLGQVDLARLESMRNQGATTP